MYRILKIVLVTDGDKLMWILLSGLTVLSEAFGFIHGMYHEATACHVLTDLSDCLCIIKSLLCVAMEKMDELNIARSKCPHRILSLMAFGQRSLCFSLSMSALSFHLFGNISYQ